MTFYCYKQPFNHPNVPQTVPVCVQFSNGKVTNIITLIKPWNDDMKGTWGISWDAICYT
jgi:hypothetical protein